MATRIRPMNADIRESQLECHSDISRVSVARSTIDFSVVYCCSGQDAKQRVVSRVDPNSAVVAARGPAAAPQTGLHQISRQELQARADHPDLFRKRATTDTSGAVFNCQSKRKRANFNEVEGVLSAKDTASFLLGGGTITWPNGTVYEDEDFAYRLERATGADPSYKVIEMSVPGYKNWKASLGHGDLIHLSDLTAVRAKDIGELEEALLAAPDFVDIMVNGKKINRRVFEVANSY